MVVNIIKAQRAKLFNYFPFFYEYFYNYNKIHNNKIKRLLRLITIKIERKKNYLYKVTK